MSSVDLRTRRDGPRPSVDPDHLFAVELPERLANGWANVGPGAHWLAPRPLTLEVDGAPFTLSVEPDAVTITRDAVEHAAVIRLTHEQLDALVHDQETFMGMFSSGRLDQPAGSLGTALDWWLVLRSALDGTPIHTPGAIDLVDEDGAPLDLTRTFSPGDDPAAMCHFLTEAGFLHLSGLFDPGEMAEIARDMDRAALTYHDGDGRSWWATTKDGTRRLVRMQGFDLHSEATAALLDDERFTRLGTIPGDGHVGRDPEQSKIAAKSRIEALFKPIGVVAGISDVPWHKDCSLGRHSYECCGLTVGISVTGADETSGQLRVRAGSHRALVWPALEQPHCDLPIVDLPTRTGDVTIHLSCTLHMAQPPVATERRVMYTGFSLPAFDEEAAIAARAHLREVREAAPITVSQAPSV